MRDLHAQSVFVRADGKAMMVGSPSNGLLFGLVIQFEGYLDRNRVEVKAYGTGRGSTLQLSALREGMEALEEAIRSSPSLNEEGLTRVRLGLPPDGERPPKDIMEGFRG